MMPHVMSSRVLAAGAFALFATTAACSKPEPPRVTPKEARVTSVSPAGLEIRLELEAVNPNRFPLAVRSVTGKMTLDGRWNLGTVTVSKPVTLPPTAPTAVDASMALPWAEVGALGVLAASPRPVPYVFEGTLSIGGERVNVDVPFSTSGELTREELANAALRSLPIPLPQLAPPR